MIDNDRAAAFRLLESGARVYFDVVDTKVHEPLSEGMTVTEIDLVLGEIEEDQEGLREGEAPYRTDDHEWGAFGFIFALAVLSFADASPRGVSDMHFVEHDEFTVGDLIERLQFVRGEIHFTSDYIRGRCVKTDVTVRKDGTATLQTRGRGEAALRWLDRLKGKKVLEVVK